MQEWILKTLIEDGTLAPSGYRRCAVVRPCRSCGRPTFQGMTAEPMACEATVDLAPLDAFGELVALTGGIKTWHLRFVAGRYEIDLRDAFDIKDNPAGKDTRYDVVATHVCGVDIPHRKASNLRSASYKPRYGPIGDPPY